MARSILPPPNVANDVDPAGPNEPLGAAVPGHLVEQPVANDVRPVGPHAEAPGAGRRQQNVARQDDERELDPRVAGFLRFAVETAVQMMLEEQAEARHDGRASNPATQTETDECTPTISETNE